MSKDYLPVRLSHLLRHCAVGSLVRGPDYLMTVKDIREWTDKGGIPAGEIIRHVCRVRTALNIDKDLREPPIAKELDNGQINGFCVPAMRFPEWMRCPGCGLLHNKPWIRLQGDQKPRCMCEKEPELEQVPWILVHSNGYMADIPWHDLAHVNVKGQKQCRRDWEDPYLRLIDQGASSQRIICTRPKCGAWNNFNTSLRIPYKKNTRPQPWISENSDAGDDPAVILEINDTRVHSPTTCNALVIPPESRIDKGSVIDLLYSSTQKLNQLERARDRRRIYTLLAKEFRCSKEEVEKAWESIEKDRDCSQYDFSGNQGLLLEAEYNALLTVIPDVQEDEDFVTEHHTTTWKHMASEFTTDSKPFRVVKSVDHLIAVNRLKEIMVLMGFQRLYGELIPPHVTGERSWLSELERHDEHPWLPALELYGEGVFFTFSEEILGRWELSKPQIERAVTIDRRLGATGLKFEPAIKISPRFLLLHTLAHLLIRQLEMEAGYPAASLKERIYCTAGKGNMSMSGILVYVAVPDVVGSLGGLAELATPERFLPLLSSVFDHAEWCSLDPVCSEHEGQGPNLLNRAACHACALVPEPSCAYGNVLLDRIFIKGDKASGIPAFLDCVD